MTDSNGRNCIFTENNVNCEAIQSIQFTGWATWIIRSKDLPYRQGFHTGKDMTKAGFTNSL